MLHLNPIATESPQRNAVKRGLRVDSGAAAPMKQYRSFQKTF